MLLIAATETDTGRTVYCQRPHMSGAYSFYPTITRAGDVTRGRGNPARQLKDATRFNPEDAEKTLALIEDTVGRAVNDGTTWLKDVRIETEA